MRTFPYAPGNINVKANIYVATVEVKVGITHVITFAKFIPLLKMADASFSSNSCHEWWMDCNSFDSISDLTSTAVVLNWSGFRMHHHLLMTSPDPNQRTSEHSLNHCSRDSALLLENDDNNIEYIERFK